MAPFVFNGIQPHRCCLFQHTGQGKKRVPTRWGMDGVRASFLPPPGAPLPPPPPGELAFDKGMRCRLTEWDADLLYMNDDRVSL